LKTIVTNVAKGSWYPQGALRLQSNLAECGVNATYHGWLGEYPPASPTHHAKPYAFKAHAVKDIIDRFDPDVVWWIDSSIIAVRAFDDMSELAIDEGVAVFNSGWSLGQWTHDQALNYYGISRTDAMSMQLLVGGIFALAPKTKIGKAVYEEWLSYAEHPDLFVGDWKNTNGKLGDPTRCLGHRHDMPALTVACRNHGIKQANLESEDFVYPPTDQPMPQVGQPEGTFYAVGPRGLSR